MRHIGYYINLDRSTDRRAFMEAQFAQISPAAPYRRFAATEGNGLGFPNRTLTDAQIGCFTSHYRLLAEHLDSTDYLHVVEDDTILAHRAARFVDEIIEAGYLDDLDILFTSSYLPEDFRSFQSARDAWRKRIAREANGTAASVQFMRFPYFASTASYIVNPRSICLIHDILAEELARGPRELIDLVIREEPRLRVRCLFPFITSVPPRAFTSTIDHDHDKRVWTFVMDLLRHSFFVDCDQRKALELAERFLIHPNADPFDQLHARIGGFLTSDAYRSF